MTVNDIKALALNAGHHYFDPDSMRFFQSKVEPEAYAGVGGTYFVTSEKSAHAARKWSIRQVFTDPFGIDTVGGFGAYKTPREAKDEARRLSRTPLQEQFERAVQAWEDAAGVYKGARIVPVPLLDSVRLGARVYIGFGHVVFEREYFSARAESPDCVRLISDHYFCAKECSRILRTQPAETSESFQPFVEITEAESLLSTLNSHGCSATKADVKRLQELAEIHHRGCVAYCNGYEGAEGRRRTTEQKIEALAARIGAKPVFQGDPRGATVKLAVPDGYTNDFGKTGVLIERNA